MSAFEQLRREAGEALAAAGIVTDLEDFEANAYAGARFFLDLCSVNGGEACEAAIDACCLWRLAERGFVVLPELFTSEPQEGSR